MNGSNFENSTHCTLRPDIGEQISDFVNHADDLTIERMAEIADHIASCKHCQNEYTAELTIYTLLEEESARQKRRRLIN